VNWVNYDDVHAELRTSGLLFEPENFPSVGKRQKCRVEGLDREKRGWFLLHEIQALDGSGLLLVGSYGIWYGSNPGTQKISLKGRPLTGDQRAALKARMAKDMQIELARRRRVAELASRRADKVWRRLSEDGECEYLVRKKVLPFGVRFSESGAMAIPLLDVSGVVHGLQVIYPRGHEKAKSLGRDKTFFPAGVIKQGHFFLIGGSPQRSTVLLLAEGYATAASLHMATGYPVAICWDAGNLVHVAKALSARYRQCKLLICADDDYLAKCQACGKYTSSMEPVCSQCGKEHRGMNAGVTGAETAALAVGGAYVTPVFTTVRPRDKKGPTDFNDLHCAEGQQAVRGQIEARISALSWRTADEPPAPPQGEGEGGDGAMSVLVSVNQLSERFSLVYEMTETVFDAAEHKLVPLSSMRNLCSSRQLHRSWMESLDKRIVRVSEVGFDPTELDDTVKCNLWGGWPTRPQAGDCSKLLELGEYLCRDDAKAGELWTWMIKWLAYPIQHPGAKMKTAIVAHGPQGTGKNVFFEAYAKIYGEYGSTVDQKAIEDKFNDTFSRKLFLVADEVVARAELYHAKNDLKHLVTGDKIRINPKNVGAYFEKNHLNLAFLSNESQPMVLERDDRRYCIIWTPPKLEQDFYHQVLAEIGDGGIAALHDHLLHLDLGDFGPATLPPTTQAKLDLIELSLDSSERFYNQWVGGELPLPVVAAISTEMYSAYRHWCTVHGVSKPAQLSTVIGSLRKRPGAHTARPWHFQNYSRTISLQSSCFWPAGAERHDGDKEGLSRDLANFNDAVIKWRSPAFEGKAHQPKNAVLEPEDDF
jgi:putative DNA primase/helicase